jgi:hypothetical protein
VDLDERVEILSDEKESEKKIVLLEYMIVVLDFYVAEKV